MNLKSSTHLPDLTGVEMPIIIDLTAVDSEPMMVIDLTNAKQVDDKPLASHIRYGTFEALRTTMIPADEVVCSVCDHDFSTFRRVVQLVCHHTFCRDCLQGHIDEKTKIQVVPLCPLCNHVI